MSDVVLLVRHGPVAVVTLNRPEKRNALGQLIRAMLLPMLTELDGDPTCRAIVLTGAGGAFCAGGDVGEMSAGTVLERRGRLNAWRDAIRLVTRSPKVFVAAVDGPAFGAGFSLALLCDYVVAGPTARFSAAFGRIGLMPDLGLLWSLPARIGPGRAKELLITGEAVDGADAARLGIADRFAPDGALPEALARAATFAEAAPAAISLIKSAFARGLGRLDEVLDYELDGQPLLTTTADHLEGGRAFRERRPPRFEGR